MLDDLLTGARRLSLAPPALRADIAARMLAEAHAAHHYMRRFGRPHPRWGNGSLMTRALADCTDRLPLCYASLAVMAAAVAHFREANSLRGHGLSLPRDLW